MRNITVLTENHAVAVGSIGSLWTSDLWGHIHSHNASFMNWMVSLHSALMMVSLHSALMLAP